MVTHGLAMRASQYAAPDAARFRRAYLEREHLAASHAQLQQLLISFDRQIEALADLPLLEHSTATMAASLDVRRTRADETKALVDRMHADVAALLESKRTASAIDTAIAHMDDEALVREHDRVMASRVQMLAAPTPPATAPCRSDDADPEMALGLRA